MPSADPALGPAPGPAPISRPSSAALSLAPHLDLEFPDSLLNDVTIAHRLLTKRSKGSQRITSLTNSASAYLHVAGWDGPSEESEPFEGTQTGHRSRREAQTSNTWTSSSGEVFSEQDEVEDRTDFVQEYNRLANKHGVRSMVPDENDIFHGDANSPSAKPGSWFFRKILRRTSSTQSIRQKADRTIKHKRSISDSLRLKPRRDKLKDKDLQELVRLCGSSLLYLPTEYAAGSLSVPTCFRATAQYLVQNATTTKGIFRIPGSHYVVSSLYNHYCAMDDEGEIIAGTVRCPSLPEHIRCDVHDVASAFKKFLSGLPGGILGSLPLFDAFISIHTQFHGDPEATRTKQSKVRARLIALAVATLRSHHRRELICAVFGLLCMVGRAAETARREDDRGRPLPTTDLMGYGPLGIVFGPLLVGDLLEDYTMRLANPHGGLILLPISPPKSRKEKQKKSKSTEDSGHTSFNTHVDKIKVANNIAEMLITHWRDVVRHLRNLDALKIISGPKSRAAKTSSKQVLRPSMSEPFALRKPRDWDGSRLPFGEPDRTSSPTPIRRVSGPAENLSDEMPSLGQHEFLSVRKQRSRPKAMSSQRLSRNRSLGILSPTVEEHHLEDLPGPSTMTKKNLHFSSSSDKENVPPPPALEGPALEFYINLTAPKSSKWGQAPSSVKNISSPRPEPAPLGALRSTSGNSSIRAPASLPYMLPVSPFFADMKGDRHSLLSETLDGVALEELPKTVVAGTQISPEPLPRPQMTTSSSRNLIAKLSSQELSDLHELLDGFPLATPQKTQDFDARIEALEKKYPNTSAFIKYIDSHPNPRKPLEDSIAKDIFSQGPSTQQYESAVPWKRLQVPQFNRRTGRGVQSEVGSPAINASRPLRKFSRSYEDPKRIRELRANQKLPLSRDPLLRISLQEDLASLATLAQALDNPEEPPGEKLMLDVAVSKTSFFETRSKKPVNAVDDVFSVTSRAKSFKEKIPVSLLQMASPQQPRSNKASDHWTKEHGGRAVKGHSQIPDFTNPVTPKRKFESKRELGPRQSPNAKVSALVAKFSNAAVTENHTSPTRGSPSKSSTKTVPDTGLTPKSRRESLVAPYTTNSPSPTRSQKSTNSEKTALALRNSPSVDRQQKLQKFSGTFKRSSPSRVFRPIVNTTPFLSFQSSQAAADKHIPRKEVRAKNSNPFSVTLRPVGKSLEGKGSPTKSRPTSTSFPVPPQPLRDGHKDRIMASNEVPQDLQKETVVFPQQPSSMNVKREKMPAFLASQRLDSESSRAKPASAAPEKNLPSNLGALFDNTVGCGDSPNYTPGLDGSTPEPQKPSFTVPNAVEIVHPGSATDNRIPPSSDLNTPRAVNPPPNPLSKIPSPMQYHKIKSLEKQLSAKIDQVQQLKQQLEVREHVDIETLTDELRDAKREIKRWRKRAELAEKQLELLNQYAMRSDSSLLRTSSSSCTTLQLQRFPVEYSLDSSKVDERLRRILHGGDGAGSSMSLDSEESTETVARRDGGEPCTYLGFNTAEVEET